MQEVFEKIKQRIKIVATEACGYAPITRVVSEAELKGIIEQTVTEYNNGWIPCSEPPKVFREENRELIPFLVCDEESQYPYRAFYDGKNWGDGFSKLNPSAWQYLPPKPYQPKGE